jgi:hypothetical protein
MGASIEPAYGCYLSETPAWMAHPKASVAIVVVIARQVLFLIIPN